MAASTKNFVPEGGSVGEFAHLNDPSLLDGAMGGYADLDRTKTLSSADQGGSPFPNARQKIEVFKIAGPVVQAGMGDSRVRRNDLG